MFFNKKKTLSKSQKDILEKLENKLKQDSSIHEQVCKLLKEILDPDILRHLSDLSNEIKIKSCIDHIKIGLVSGDINIEEVKKMIL